MAIIKYGNPITGEFKDIKFKVSDTLPVGTKVDYDGTDVPNGWEEVTDPSVYSTEEKIIGTWIDGKPIYSKTIEGTILKIDENVIIGTIPNIDTVIRKYGQSLAGGQYWTDLDLKFSETVGSIIQIEKGSGQMIAIFSKTYINHPFHITVNYTKTTDTATNTVNTINDEPTSEEV